MAEKKYKTFWSFYPYYLTEHKNPVSRRLHFIGTALIIICLIAGIITGRWIWFIIIPLCGYGFAWVGHFIFEKSLPRRKANQNLLRCYYRLGELLFSDNDGENAPVNFTEAI